MKSSRELTAVYLTDDEMQAIVGEVDRIAVDLKFRDIRKFIRRYPKLRELRDLAKDGRRVDE